MRPIQIGIEVHKAIEAERRSLSEPENEILMRLLGLKPLNGLPPAKRQEGKASWIKEGVELPEGTLLRAIYSGQEITGVVQNAQWIVEGRPYASPSMAIIHNVRTKDGSKTNLNGWNHWTVKRPTDTKYIKLSSLRGREWL